MAENGFLVSILFYPLPGKGVKQFAVRSVGHGTQHIAFLFFAIFVQVMYQAESDCQSMAAGFGVFKADRQSIDDEVFAFFAHQPGFAAQVSVLRTVCAVSLGQSLKGGRRVVRMKHGAVRNALHGDFQHNVAEVFVLTTDVLSEFRHKLHKSITDAVALVCRISHHRQNDIVNDVLPRAVFQVVYSGYFL